MMKKMNGGKQMKDTDWIFGLCKGKERLGNGVSHHFFFLLTAPAVVVSVEAEGVCAVDADFAGVVCGKWY
jgi:hypothetical protein